MEEEMDSSPSPIDPPAKSDPKLPSPIPATSASTSASASATAAGTSKASAANLPSIADVPFHEWLCAMTSKNGPYPRGIHISHIREVADEQWRKKLEETESAAAENKEAPKTESAGSGYQYGDGTFWKNKKQLFLLLSEEMAAGRIKRIATGYYMGVDVEVVKKRKAKPKSLFSSPNRKRRLIQRSKLRCQLCFKPAGHEHPSLQCMKCGIQYHISCAQQRRKLPADLQAIKDPEILASKINQVMSVWYCDVCKRCSLCDGESDEVHGNGLLLCDRCDTSEHYKCQIPIPTKVPTMPWYCTKCRVLKTKIRKKLPPLVISTTSIGKGDTNGIYLRRKRPAESGSGQGDEMPVLEKNVVTEDDEDGNGGGKKKEKVNYDKYGLPSLYDSSILRQTGRDVKNWSLRKVIAVFEAMGHGSVAQVMKQQEIDGPALLLLTRHDVISKMNLKLGPAVKAQRLIEHLQNVCDVLRFERLDRIKEQQSLQK